jgi:hypothetical protein
MIMVSGANLEHQTPNVEQRSKPLLLATHRA